MLFRDVLKQAYFNTIRGGLRSFLTMSSVIIGIASVILVSSVGTSGESLILNEVQKIGLAGISVFPTDAKDSKPLEEEDVILLKNRFSNIEFAIPVVLELGEMKFNRVSSDSVFLGIGDGADYIYNVNLLFGRVPTKRDVRQKQNVVVIDNELAEKAYKRENVVGKEIVLKIGNRAEKFKVIGVIGSQKEGLNQVFGNSMPDFVYMPYTTLNELRESTELTQIAIKCSENDVDCEIFADFLNKTKGTPRGYRAENVSSRINEVKSITGLVKLIVSAIASIALCVAGIGIMNSMFSSCFERKREIGICMAVGAEPRDIMACFITEAVIVSLIGGTVGALIGILFSKLISTLIGLKFLFDLKLFIIAEALAVIFGVLFSAIPAFEASKLNPIEALRRG